MRYGRYAGVVVGIALILIQFVPVARTNRLGAGDPEVPREVMYVLRRACYDCHSTETRWPIWAYVAPMSWLVVRDVERARRTINFSDWVAYPAGLQVAYRMMVEPVTSTHRMPLWYYLTLHPDAALSEEDLALLSAWSRGALPVELAPADLSPPEVAPVASLPTPSSAADTLP